MTIIENLELLIKAVEDEPEQLFNLMWFERTAGCGTLHCTLGLAATMPGFQEQGLTLVGSFPVLEGRFTANNNSSNLDILFGKYAFARLFKSRNFGVWDREFSSPTSDKELALLRLRKQLAEELKCIQQS